MPVRSDSLAAYNEITNQQILEFVHGETSMRNDKFSSRKADLDMTFKIPGNKLRGALMHLLGIDYVLYDASGYTLHRKVPMYHPFHNWAWCTSVNVNGQMYNGDEIPTFLDQTAPAKWKQFTCTASFEMPAYRLYPDGATAFGGLEYKRYVQKQLIPHVELISVDAGQVVLDANAGDAWNGQPRPSLVPIGRRQTCGVRLTWHRVPLEWVQADDDNLPLKLMQVQGCVNSATFLGQAAETLLCINVDLGEKYVSSLVSNDIDSLYFMYDITIDLAWWSQDTADVGKTGETRRGHNLQLGPSLKYWYATNATSSDPVFKLRDFTKIFTHYSDAF